MRRESSLTYLPSYRVPLLVTPSLIPLFHVHLSPLFHASKPTSLLYVLFVGFHVEFGFYFIHFKENPYSYNILFLVLLHIIYSQQSQRLLILLYKWKGTPLSLIFTSCIIKTSNNLSQSKFSKAFTRSKT